jgi:ubiquinone/menaquinone biosynthesis C-methylase UbiE
MLAAMGIQSFYEQRIFPHILDRAMRGMEELRPKALDGAHGDVLEIGFGTGLNLRHYPEGVERLSTVDPMDALPEKVTKRIGAAAFPVDVHHLPADGELPFDSGRFDTATVTWTLCTIPDPVAALREVKRVLKPGAKLLFIEHGLSDDPSVARWQQRFNPIQNVIGCGCNLNRKIDRIILEAGFDLPDFEFFVGEGMPAMFGTLYRGAASS